MTARDDGELVKLSMLDGFARPLQFILTTRTEMFCSTKYFINATKDAKNAVFSEMVMTKYGI